MDFSGTEPSLLVPEACSWGVTCGHRVDKGGVSWGDVALGTLRSPDVGEPPPHRSKARTARSGPSTFSGLTWWIGRETFCRKWRIPDPRV